MTRHEIQQTCNLKGPLGQHGFVYIVQSETVGPIKIGHARHVSERLTKLRSGSPYKLHLLCVLRGGREREKELHRMFKSARLHGEWFKPCPELFRYIARAKAEGQAVES